MELLDLSFWANRVVSEPMKHLPWRRHCSQLCPSRQDLTHHTLHVRLLRHYISSHNRHRLPLENHVPGGPHGSITAVGHSGPRTIPLTHTLIHPRLLSRRGCLRHLLKEDVRANEEVDR